jgi:excisionase family DNA binding protein
MSALFYSVKEAAQKLNKTEAELRTIAERGVLREFRHGAQVLFRREEVEAIAPRVNEFTYEEISLIEAAERSAFDLMLPDIETVSYADSSQTEKAKLATSEQEEAEKEPVETRQSINFKLHVKPVSMVNVRSKSSRLTPWQWFVTGLVYDRPGPVLLLFAALYDIIWRSAALIYVAYKLF